MVDFCNFGALALLESALRCSWGGIKNYKDLLTSLFIWFLSWCYITPYGLWHHFCRDATVRFPPPALPTEGPPNNIYIYKWVYFFYCNTDVIMVTVAFFETGHWDDKYHMSLLLSFNNIRTNRNKIMKELNPEKSFLYLKA